jgi:hypothetical protein
MKTISVKYSTVWNQNPFVLSCELAEQSKDEWILVADQSRFEKGM